MWLRVVRGGRVTVFKGLVLFSVGYTSHLVYRMCVEAADVVGVCLKKLAVAGSLLPCTRSTDRADLLTGSQLTKVTIQGAVFSYWHPQHLVTVDVVRGAVTSTTR